MSKDRAPSRIMQYIRERENLFSPQGYKLVAIRTDGGGEFVNTTLDNYFAAKGIRHNVTPVILQN